MNRKIIVAASAFGLMLGMTAPACGLELTEVFYRDKDLNGEN